MSAPFRSSTSKRSLRVIAWKSMATPRTVARYCGSMGVAGRVRIEKKRGSRTITAADTSSARARSAIMFSNTFEERRRLSSMLSFWCRDTATFTVHSVPTASATGASAVRIRIFQRRLMRMSELERQVDVPVPRHVDPAGRSPESGVPRHDRVRAGRQLGEGVGAVVLRSHVQAVREDEHPGRHGRMDLAEQVHDPGPAEGDLVDRVGRILAEVEALGRRDAEDVVIDVVAILEAHRGAHRHDGDARHEAAVALDDRERLAPGPPLPLERVRQWTDVDHGVQRAHIGSAREHELAADDAGAGYAGE